MLAEGSRICIVLPKGIGDVVLGLAVATALKSAQPGAHLTWVTNPPAAPILNQHKAVDQVIQYSASPFRRRWRGLRKELRTRPIDLLLNLGMYLHALPPVLFARSRRVVGLGRPFAKDGLWFFHDENVEPLRDGHTQDQYLRILAHLDIPAEPVDWSLSVTQAEEHSREAYVKSVGQAPKIGMVLTSGRAEKDWPEERFAELAKRMNAQFGVSVILLGGPGPAEMAKAKRVRDATGTFVHNELGCDLRRLMWLSTACDVLVAPDTGPVHIARALNVPVVALYGHTDPKRYGPYKLQRGMCIDRYNFDAPGVPTSWHGSGGRAGRMELISTEEVALACGRLLESAASDFGSHPAQTGETL